MTKYYLKSASYLFHRWVLRKKFLMADIPQHGLKVKCKTADYLGRHLYKRGIYEAELSGFLGAHLPFEAGDVFLDVGANIGWHSLLLARKHPDLQVYAFEPEPENIALLQHNIRINGLTNVEVIPRAASFEEGEQEFYLYADKNAGRHSLLPINEGKVITVPLTTLDHFIKERGLSPKSIKLLKIDVEGYELNVLRGAESLVGEAPVILLEFSPEYMRKGGIDPEDLVSLLEEAQYRPHLLKAGELRPVRSEQLLALPPDQDVFWILDTARLR